MHHLLSIIHPFIYLSIYLSIYLFIYPSIHPSIHIYLSIHLYLSIYLSHKHTHLHNSEYPYGSENEPVMISAMSIRVITVLTKHGNHANRRNCTTLQNCSLWRNMSKLKARYQLNDCLQARASLITALHTCRWWAHDTSDQLGERLTDRLRL